MHKWANPHHQPITEWLSALCIPPTAAVLILQLSISPLKSLAHCSSDCSNPEHRKTAKLKTKLLTTVVLSAVWFILLLYKVSGYYMIECEDWKTNFSLSVFKPQTSSSFPPHEGDGTGLLTLSLDVGELHNFCCRPRKRKLASGCGQ